jgi:HK97 family phage major capsid protein
MKRIKELRQQRADLVAKMRALIDAAQKREEPALTEDEEKQYEEHKAALARTEKAIEIEEEQLEREKRLGTPPSQTVTSPQASRVEVTLDGADRPFRSFGEQLMAIQQAGTPGGRVDDRLYGAASGGSAQSNTDGGYLIQADFSTEIYKRAYEMAQLASRCQRIGISATSDRLVAPYIEETSRATGSRWGGVRVYRRAEAETVTASRPKIGEWELRLEDLMGIAYMTGRQMEDAPAMSAIYQEAFAEEFAWIIDDEILNGKGAGQCLGVVNAPCKVKVAKESGQAADTVNALNIMKMWARMWMRSRGNAVWFINQDVEIQLQQMVVSTGGGTNALVYMPPGGLSGQPYGTLYSRPVLPIEQAPAIGDEGDIVLADFSQYVLIDKGGMRQDQSMHVRFLYDEMAFRFMMRINGQPKWRKPVTAAKGSTDYSPFVTLEAR